MNLRVISSGSVGNAYLLTSNSGQRLLLDCGIAAGKLKVELDFDLSDIFCIASHVHADHCASAGYLSRCGVPVLTTQGVVELFSKNDHLISVKHGTELLIDEFYIRFFDVVHNVPTLGALIFHPEMGNLVYITDTKEVKYNLPDVSWWLIEANYCEDYVLKMTANGSADVGRILDVVDRHFSVQACESYLRSQDLSKAESVVLLHLSDRNSHAKEFKHRIERAIGVPTYIAEPGLQLDLNLNPWGQ